MKRDRVIEFIALTFGVLLMAIGFYYFMLPYNLIAGGFSGLAIIITKQFGIDVAVLLYAMNIGAMLLGWMVFDTKFLTKTIYGSLLFPFGIQVCQWVDRAYDISPITDDILLSVVFASLLLGVGLGTVLRFGGTTGGMDIPQKILNVKLHLPFSLTVYGLDGLVVGLGIIYFGIEIGLYSLLSLLIIGRIIDMTIIAGKHTKSVYIITKHPEKIKQLIFERIDRGISEIDVVGGFTGDNRKMLLCVVTNRQYYTVIKSIHQIDEDAFVFANNSSEVLGEGFHGYNTLY